MSSEQAIGEQTGAATKARPLQTTSAQAGGGEAIGLPSPLAGAPTSLNPRQWDGTARLGPAPQ
jgi:hypothetical protein